MNKIKNEEKPHKHRTEREYLTIDELRKLAQTPFYNGLLKKAFLFSCFCGLRHSDIIALTWGDIEMDDDGNSRLYIIQKENQGSHFFAFKSGSYKTVTEARRC